MDRFSVEISVYPGSILSRNQHQDEALEMSDRVAILNRGAVEQIGTPDEIYDRPATSFVYDFVGAANHLPVEIRNGHIRLGDLQLSRTPAAYEFAGDLYFRLEHASLDLQAGLPRGPVTGVGRVGARRRVDIRLDHAGANIEVDLPRALVIKPSDRIGLKLERFSVFSGGKPVPLIAAAACAV